MDHPGALERAKQFFFRNFERTFVVLLVASLLAMIMIANLQYSWTLFVKPLQTGTGWKLSDIQLAFTLFILCQTWVQPLDGWLIDRLGPRGFISAAGLLCGLGWAGMGRATSLPALYALYCVAGVGAAFVYSVVRADWRTGSPSQSSPSQRSADSMPSTHSSLFRSASVSSMRRIITPR